MPTMNEQEKPPERLTEAELAEIEARAATLYEYGIASKPWVAIKVVRADIPKLIAAVRADLAPADVWDEAIQVLRGHLCVPYTTGRSCEECDTRMRDIERLEAARDAALEPKGTKA